MEFNESINVETFNKLLDIFIRLSTCLFNKLTTSTTSNVLFNKLANGINGGSAFVASFITFTVLDNGSTLNSVTVLFTV